MHIDPSNIIGLDLETGGDEELFGLQPWRVQQGRARIKTYALAWQDGNGQLQRAGKMWPDRQGLHAVLEKLASSGRYVATWNGAFDVAWLVANGHWPQVSRIKWLDGLLLWRHLEVTPEYDENRDKRRSFSLESAIRTYYGDAAADAVKGFDDFDAVDEASMRQLLARNLGDAEYTFRITCDLIRRLSEHPRRLMCAMVEAFSIPHVGRANCFGMRTNQGKVHALTDALDAKAASLLAELGPMGITETVIASPKQLGEVLYNQWGLPILSKTASGQPATDKVALYNLAQIDPRAKKVKEFRETNMNKAKFANAILEANLYLGEARTYPTARIFGTYTGRMTYNSKVGRRSKERPISSAMHQTKRGKDYRQMHEAPDGYDIVEFDAANQEYRWMAILSRDETMLGLCQPGEDAHGYMGAQIIGVDYATMLRVLQDEDHVSYKDYKNGRQLGKVANLSLQYRTSAGKLRDVSQVQYDVPMDMRLATQAHGMYQRTYRRVPQYWNDSIAFGRANGYVETIAGRQVQLVDPWDRAHKWMLESTCINYRVQGTGADQKYLALMCIQPLLTKHHAYFWFEMHDGVYFIVPKERTAQFVTEGKQLLANLPYQRAWGFTSPIPLPWDAKVGPSWGELKEWKQ